MKKQRVTLSINTANNEETVVSLRIGEKTFVSKKKTDRRTQTVLPMVDALLKKHRLTLEDITNIEVNVGPGSFTGLRVGVAIANTLGSILQIPINEMPVGTPAEPVYS